MDPWRAGDENFPDSQLINPQDNTIREAEDSPPPTINVHYDFKPRDWYAIEQHNNETVELDRAMRQVREKFARDSTNRAIQAQDMEAVIRQTQLELLKDYMATRQRTDRSRLLRVFSAPDWLLSGTILGTGRMAEKLKMLNAKAKQKQQSGGDSTTEAEYPSDVSFQGAEDVHLALAEQLAGTAPEEGGEEQVL